MDIQSGACNDGRVRTLSLFFVFLIVSPCKRSTHAYISRLHIACSVCVIYTYSAVSPAIVDAVAAAPAASSRDRLVLPFGFAGDVFSGDILGVCFSPHAWQNALEFDTYCRHALQACCSFASRSFGDTSPPPAPPPSPPASLVVNHSPTDSAGLNLIGAFHFSARPTQSY